MKSIIYISQESYKLTFEDLQNILFSSRKLNEANDISGILFYIEGIFLQYIEGNNNNIDKLYQSILKDKRHHKINLIKSELINYRKCSGWNMIFKNLKIEEMKIITGLDIKDSKEFYEKVIKNNKYIYQLIEYLQ